MPEPKGDDMHISRAPKLEWNLNTILQLISIVGVIAGGIYIWANTTRDIEELKTWRGNHEQIHKDRLAEVKGIEARSDERFKNLESEVRRISGKTDNLDYRLTSSEQAMSGVVQTMKDIQQLQAVQSGDLREIKVILQRMEKGARP